MDIAMGDVEAAASADDGFAAFYERELDRQVRHAFLLVGSNEVANDVVHDAFVAIYRRWHQVADPGPYLNRVVVNSCRDVHRRQARVDRSLARLAVGAAETTAPDVLDDVLNELPFNQRAAVVLRFYGQFTTSEIAASLGCPQGSVGPWINRALAHMRKALG